MQARTCAWLFSAANCDKSLIPTECRDLVEESPSSSSVSPDLDGALNDGAKSVLSAQSTDGLIPNLVSSLLGPALSAAFGRSLDATASRSIQRPNLFGGGHQAVSGHYHLACNLKPTTPGEVALDAWHRFRP